MLGDEVDPTLGLDVVVAPGGMEGDTGVVDPAERLSLDPLDIVVVEVVSGGDDRCDGVVLGHCLDEGSDLVLVARAGAEVTDHCQPDRLSRG